MYTFVAINKRAEKEYHYYLQLRSDIRHKLQKLQEDPRRACGAHPLHGRFFGTWSCWLGSNIRMRYLIDDEKKLIFIMTIGSHAIYG